MPPGGLSRSLCICHIRLAKSGPDNPCKEAWREAFPPDSATSDWRVIMLMLTACTGSGMAPPSTQESIMSPTIRPDDIIGCWGYAAYYNDADWPRIEAAARGLCGQPIEIRLGPTGGVIMPVANQPQSQEVKGRSSRQELYWPSRSDDWRAGQRDRVFSDRVHCHQ